MNIKLISMTQFEVICTRVIQHIKWVLHKESGKRSSSYNCTSQVTYPFLTQKTVSMTFLTDCCTRDFSFTVKSVWFYSVYCLFDILPICKDILTKTYFIIHITHSSIYFILFELVSHQKFDDKSLFKRWALCLIHCHFK